MKHILLCVRKKLTIEAGQKFFYINWYVAVEVRNSQVTKLSYETELGKMTSHFELLTRKCLEKIFF